MAEGRGLDNWWHTSSLMALIANVNRDPKKGRAYKPKDFDPYARLRSESQRQATKADLALLRQMFESQKPK
jgi:hypothetical protein